MTSQADGAVAIPDVRVCADIDDLSRRAAEAVGDRLNDAVRTRGTCSIVSLPLRQVLEVVGDWIRYPAAGIRQGAGTII
jgi:hypothetical protein